MNPIVFVCISFSLAFAISTSVLFSFVPSSSAMSWVFVFIVYCLFVCVRRFVLEQVRRRLKSRQPGGRRRSKGFRLVPPSIVAVHPRAGARQIKRARADNTRHWAHRDTRVRKAERERDGRERSWERRLRPSVYASKTVSWQGNSLEDDTPVTSSSWPGWKGRSTVDRSVLEKKEREASPVLFFDAVHCGSRTGIWKAPGGWAKYVKLVNATEVNTREESEARK